MRFPFGETRDPDVSFDGDQELSDELSGDDAPTGDRAARVRFPYGETRDPDTALEADDELGDELSGELLAGDVLGVQSSTSGRVGALDASGWDKESWVDDLEDSLDPALDDDLDSSPDSDLAAFDSDESGAGPPREAGASDSMAGELARLDAALARLGDDADPAERSGIDLDDDLTRSTLERIARSARRLLREEGLPLESSGIETAGSAEHERDPLSASEQAARQFTRDDLSEPGSERPFPDPEAARPTRESRLSDPVVFLDEDNTSGSMRFMGSIVDNSARLAGMQSGRQREADDPEQPGGRGRRRPTEPLLPAPPENLGESWEKASWIDEESLDEGSLEEPRRPGRRERDLDSFDDPEVLDPGLSGDDISDLSDDAVLEAGEFPRPERAAPTRESRESAPIVFIDDDQASGSMRFAASIVDNSTRLAGVASRRSPRPEEPSDDGGSDHGASDSEGPERSSEADDGFDASAASDDAASRSWSSEEGVSRSRARRLSEDLEAAEARLAKLRRKLHQSRDLTEELEVALAAESSRATGARRLGFAAAALAVLLAAGLFVLWSRSGGPDLAAQLARREREIAALRDEVRQLRQVSEELRDSRDADRRRFEAERRQAVAEARAAVAEDRDARVREAVADARRTLAAGFADERRRLEAEAAAARTAAAEARRAAAQAGDPAEDERLRDALAMADARRKALEDELAAAREAAEAAREKAETARQSAAAEAAERARDDEATVARLQKRRAAGALSGSGESSGDGWGDGSEGGDDGWGDEGSDDGWGDAAADDGWGDGGGGDDGWGDGGSDDSWGDGGGDDGWGEATTAAEEDKPLKLRILDFVKENVFGSVAYKNLTHEDDEDALGRQFRQTRHELRIRLEYKGPLVGSLSLYSEVDAFIDDDDYSDRLVQTVRNDEARRAIVNFNELYLLQAVGPLDIRAGFQTFAWGTGDLQNPTDNLNPRDLSDLFDSRKMGVLALRTNLYLLGFNLEGVFVPFFTPNRLPPEGKRFSAGLPDFNVAVGPVQVQPDVIVDRQLPDPARGSQGGLRLSRSLAGWDLSVSFYDGYNKVPVPRVRAFETPTASGVPDLRILTELFFERIRVYGADFATTLAWIDIGGALGDIFRKTQVHGEAAFFDTNGETGDDYFQYVVGFNYTFNDVLFDHDITLLVDYLDEIVIDRRERFGFEDLTTNLSPLLQSLAQPFLPAIQQAVRERAFLQRGYRGSISTRLSYAFSDTLELVFTNVFVLRGAENAYLQSKVVWDVTDNLRVEGGHELLTGPRDTFFGQYRDNDRVFFLARVSF